MASHSFDPVVAKDVGIPAAIIFRNICFWIEKNTHNDRNFFEGRYWTYNSREAWADLFEYMSDNQVRRALEKLRAAGYIDVGNFNEHKYDRTLWYSIGQNCPKVMDIPPKALAQSNLPIPDNKPDNKPDTPSIPKGEVDEIFEKLWKYIRQITPKPLMTRHSKKNAKKKFHAIVTRKSDPIPAGRLAHAIMWFYDQEPQKKDDRQYIKGIVPLLNQESFAPYLGDGPFKIRTAKDDQADEWQSIANYVNNSDGEWPAAAPSPRTCPVEYRKLFLNEYWPDVWRK